MNQPVQSPHSVPLIAHVVHHFYVGGMENGMVNLINQIPAERYRHAVICLDGFSDFHKRIHASRRVQFYALGKRAGRDVAWYGRLWKLLRELKPDIVHTRNLSALEGQFVAAAAGFHHRIHGEHGRDVFDLHGKNYKYNLLRKAAKPLVGHYIAVSKDLAEWLRHTVGVAPARISQIYNGVDVTRFHPGSTCRTGFGPAGFADETAFVIGSVGRMAEVKNFPIMVRAFLRLLELAPHARKEARLVIIGDGVTRSTCQTLLHQANAEQYAWLPGERSDIPQLMRDMDLFVLPSLGEGISNTILEAMASGLPIVATNVGGNPELVVDGENGSLIPAADEEKLAQTLLYYYQNREMGLHQGQMSRKMAESRFSIPAMADRYIAAYDKLLGQST